MAVKVIGDSTMDLSPESQKRLGIPCTPFTIMFGQEAKHDTTFENEEMYEYNATHKNICTSSAVNVGELMEFFKEQSADGSDLLYLSISSKLSSGYQNALIAKGDDPHIHPYDSQNMSLGIALMALKAKELADDGKTIEEILPILDEYRDNTCATLIVEDVSYMARGGRISKATALGVNLLKIRPVITIRNGTLATFKKLIGKSTRKLAKKYVDAVVEEFPDIDYSLALVGYTSTRDEGVDDVVNELKARGFRRVEETKTNATNAVHGGPNVYGIAFITSNKPKKKHLDIYGLGNYLNARCSVGHVRKEVSEGKKHWED